MQIPNGVRAGLVAAVVSGAPSTLHAMVTGGDPFEATEAAGSMLLPTETNRDRLVLAAIPVHLGISIAWSTVLGIVLPRRRPVLEGAVAGLAIGIFDLAVVGRHLPRIRRLALGPQLADHIAFGIVVALLSEKN